MKTLLQISIIALFLGAFVLMAQSQNLPSKINPGRMPQVKPLDSITLASQCVQGMITIKLKKGVGDFGKQTGQVIFGIQSLDDKVAQYQVNRLEKRFQYNPAKWHEGLPDLSRIYKISFPDHFPLSDLVNAFSADPDVEYAEAIPVGHMLDVPNDSLFSQLQHLPQIHAPEAWGIHKGQDGTTPVVIAINDTGIDWDHVDLLPNIWQNLAEDADHDGHTIEFNGTQWVLDPGDLNGIDDDGNGHIDDLVGWNFITNTGDPNPIPGNPMGRHGTHCAGIANARTDNGKGISGISWNLKTMGICVDANNTVPYAYDGMIYAAENGADIISNSWGGALDYYSQADQEAVNYASGLGSIIVAAAGNENNSVGFYPADYRHVIAVASVSVDDTRAGYSSYGHAVDIAAPGGGSEGGILSTIPGDAYDWMSGTSMASPLVAGCFGLLKSYHPGWSNDQLITQVIGTADNIDSLNPGFETMLGSGRVNAYRMLTETNVNMNYLEMDLVSVVPADANGNGINEPGENVTLNFNMYNYTQLTGADNVNVSLTSDDPDIIITNGSCVVNVPADSSFSIHNQLQIQVGPNATCHFADLVIHFQSSVEIIAGKDISFKLLVNPSGILVYEGNKTDQDYSGTFIGGFLDHLGYSYTYTNTITSLKGFETVFLSCGNIGQNLDKGTPLTRADALALQVYLQAGGKAYVEMGGMYYFMYYYPNRDVLKQLLGMNAVQFSEDENPIDTLKGVVSTPMAGMVFAGSDQKYNWHIDRISPKTGAFIPFKERNYGTGNVSVMYDGSATFHQKSFYMGYTLADLRDRDTLTSRYNVLLKTMRFFGYTPPQGYLLANFATNKKTGGTPLEVHFTDISLSDHGYPVTSWQWDFNNDGTIDSYDQNPVWTYTTGGRYTVKMITSNGFKTDTLVREGYITVNSGLLVYEGIAGGHDYSGTFIRDYLTAGSFPVTYTNTMPENLEGFSAAFFSFGNVYSGWTVLDNQMAGIIGNYLDNGGYAYLEGDVSFGYDQSSNTHLRQLFGLSSATLGTTNPVDSLGGQPGALTNGMLFTGNSQSSNAYIDKYVPSLTGKAAFAESNYGTVAVQNKITNSHRTFCFSYALSRLNDGEEPNTRETLLNRILNFFGIFPTGVPDGQKPNAMNCKVYPNPASDIITIESMEPGSDMHGMLTIYGMTGNVLINKTVSSSISTINVSSLPTGIYFIRLVNERKTEIGKFVRE